MNEPRRQISTPGSFWSLFDRPGGWLFFLGLLLIGSGALMTQWTYIEDYKNTPLVENIALPKPQYVKHLAIGYDAWFADFLYLRAIQVFGGIFNSGIVDEAEQEAAFNLFKVISTLDPHFMDAYKFGSMAMGDEAGDQERALEYLKFGQKNNWRKYLPWYDAAYVKVHALKELDKEAQYYVRQSDKAHDAPSYVGRLENMILEASGDFQLALLRWLEYYAQAVEENDAALKRIAENRIGISIEQWHKSILDRAIDQYIEDRGQNPRDLQQLEREGYLGPVDVVDYQTLMMNLAAYESMGRPIAPHIEQIFDNSFVTKSGVLPPVKDPRDRYVLFCAVYDPPEADLESKAREATAYYLGALRREIEIWRQENGEFPPSLNALREIFELDTDRDFPPSAFCNEFQYDPETGIVIAPAAPDL